jgi:tetratricopeptide (TPR) repeat protein
LAPRAEDEAGLPPLPAFAAVEPSSEERLADALQVFESTPPGARQRAALRESLARHLTRALPSVLAKGQDGDGYKRFRLLISLYRNELARGERQLGEQELAPLAKAARLLHKAFSKRGAALETLTALGVLETVDASSRNRWQREFDQVVDWLTELEEPLLGSVVPFNDPGEALGKVFELWPSPFVRERLSLLLTRQYVAIRPFPLLPKLPTDRPYRLALDAANTFPWERLRLLLLEGDTYRAKKYLDSMRAQGGGDQRLLGLATLALGPKATSKDWIALAEAYAPRWPSFTQEICSRLAKADPSDASAHFCLGSLALGRERTLVAIGHLADALRANPRHREAWERFAAAYLDRLVALLGQERLDQVEREVRFLELFHGAAQKRWPGNPLKTSLADVYFVLGRGLFNEGRIDEAVRTLERAMRLKPTPQIHMQLGEIHFWRGKHRQAIRSFQDVYADLKDGSAWRAYWELRLAPIVARSHSEIAKQLDRDASKTSDLPTRVSLERAAKTERATADLVRSHALQVGKALLTNFRSNNLRAEILYHVGWIFWQAGQQRIALQSFNTALDEAPNRSSTYVDVISFLVMRGHFDDALDAYHRALARPEVSEYLKAYCTFWILDLGRRAKVDPERLGLAEVYLRHLRGSQWFHRLARFVRKELTYEALAKEATTKGQRAELDFYHSMALLEQGKAREARALWQRIVDSEMMAFFEYKMVRSYLASGAPEKPEAPPAP